MAPSGPCADCFSGSLRTDTPTGYVDAIHGLQTYVAQPEEGVVPKGIVVMIPDAFGWKMPNNRLLCDAYAKKGGFLVYLPDFMNGVALPSVALSLMATINNPGTWLNAIFIKPFAVLCALFICVPPMIRIRSSATRPRVLQFFQALRTSEPPFATSNLKIGAAGFCWGGQHVFHLAQNLPESRTLVSVSRESGKSVTKDIEKPLIDCAFSAHPGFLDVPRDVHAVTRPLSVTVGDVDMAMKSPDILQMYEILEKNKGHHECIILPGAKHGFAVRSDPEDPLQMKYADQAEIQALAWFNKWLG